MSSKYNQELEQRLRDATPEEWELIIDEVVQNWLANMPKPLSRPRLQANIWNTERRLRHIKCHYTRGLAKLKAAQTFIGVLIKEVKQ